MFGSYVRTCYLSGDALGWMETEMDRGSEEYYCGYSSLAIESIADTTVMVMV